MTKKSYLDSIQSPLPCSKDWNEMVGDEHLRFCRSCEKNVYNLSSMTRREARKFVAQNSGKVCVRYIRLPDGKVQTADTKLHKITRRTATLAAGVFGAALTLSTIANAQTPEQPKSASTKTIKSQNNLQTSRISFTVCDANGAVIPNAVVALVNPENNQEFVAYTNSEGVAVFDTIPRAAYGVKFSAQYFKSITRSILVKEAVEPNLKIYLEVAGAEFVGVVVETWSEIPLFTSIADKQNEAVKKAIASGFDVNTKDKTGRTALHVAVESGNIEIIKLLLERGAKVNVKNKNKLPPIWMISESDDETALEIFQLLIAKGADVNIPNEDKETLLMLACEDDNLEAAKILLEAGANPNLKDEDGETALEKTERDEIKQLLKQYGAK